MRGVAEREVAVKGVVVVCHLEVLVSLLLNSFLCAKHQELTRVYGMKQIKMVEWHIAVDNNNVEKWEWSFLKED